MQAGDRVVVYISEHDAPYERATVTRVSARMVTVQTEAGTEYKFTHRGYEYGDDLGYNRLGDWKWEQVEVLNIKVRMRKEHRELSDRLNRLNYQGRSLNQLRRIVAIVDEGKEQKDAGA